MNIVIKKNNAIVLNAAFILWMFSEMLFEYSMFSRIALGLFVGLVLLVTRKPCWTGVLTGYGLFVLWSAINIWTGHAIDKTIAGAATQTVLLNLLFLWALVNYCEYIGSISEILRIFKWTVFAVCALCLLGGFNTVLAGERLKFLDMNPNALAMMASFAVILFVWDCTEREKDGKWLTEICVIGFLLLTILMTGSRKGLVIPIVGVYILTVFRKPGKFIFHSLAVVLLAGAVLYVLLNVPVLYNLIGYRIEPVLQYLQGEEYDEGSLTSRLGLIELAWEQSQNSPFWGHGLDCFRTLSAAYNTYSHCNYVELLFSLGWTGTIIFYFPYLLGLLRTPYAIKQNRRYGSVAVALMIPFLICNYFVVAYYVRIYLVLPTIAMLVLRKGETNREVREVY